MKTLKIKVLSRLVLFLVLIPAALGFFTIDAAAAPLEQDGPTYIVQEGDTLTSIAVRFGVSSEDIQAANDISDPNSLQIGQQLTIPGLEGISGLLTSTALPYGTSLRYLSRKYQMDTASLVVLNHLISPSETIAGAVFLVSVSDNQENLSPLISIEKGMTPLEAAVQASTSTWKLVEDNRLAATWDMLSGEMLFGTEDETGESTVFSDVSELFVYPLPAVQGETLEIGISSAVPAEFSATFNGEKLLFHTDDGENYYSISSIHAMSETGPFPLEITMTLADGTTQTFEQMVIVEAGGYGNDAVIIVDNIYIDPDTIEAEDAIINEIFSQITEERYWEGQFQYPIDEPCINGYFGQRRDYNNGALYYYHTGVDFGVCAQNLNIYAPAAGKVVFAEGMVIRGNAVLIDHGWGVFSGYWHLSEFNVEVGDFVQAGDLIGLIGDTGRSLGPHLHFEIDILGTPVNPQTWFSESFP